MNLTGNITHDSEALPGVRFTVKRLNYISRSERDLALLDDRSKLTAIMRRMEALVIDGDLAEAKPIKGKEDEYTRLNAEYALLHQTRIVPAYVRAGFISIEGLDIDGKPATAADILDHAPDEFLDEVFAACVSASGLTEAQRKNSLSPGSSDAPEAGLQSNTTADAAKQ